MVLKADNDKNSSFMSGKVHQIDGEIDDKMIEQWRNDVSKSMAYS